MLRAVSHISVRQSDWVECLVAWQIYTTTMLATTAGTRCLPVQNDRLITSVHSRSAEQAADATARLQRTTAGLVQLAAFWCAGEPAEKDAAGAERCRSSTYQHSAP